MKPEDLMYIEALGICFVLVLILFIANFKYWKGKFINSYSLLYICGMIVVALDICWKMMDGKPEWAALNNVSEFVYFTFFIFFQYFYFDFVVSQIPFKIYRDKGIRFVYMIPAIIVSILSFISIWTGWVYRIDMQTGEYQRGSLHYVLFSAPGYIYVIASSILAFVASKHTPLTSEKKQMYSLATFPIFAIVCELIQLLFQGIPVSYYGIVASLFIIYVTFSDRRISKDSLTNLPNRYSIDGAIFEKISKYKEVEEKKLFLIMLDADNFKSINDHFGHTEGDRALQIMADVLYKVTDRYGGFVGRYGGDEFAILIQTSSRTKVDAIVTSISYLLQKASETERFNLEISAGVCEYNGHYDGKTFIDLADKKLYENKQARKMARIANID